MPHPIQPLPLALAHRIAAGEVIDSLAAAVRELAENALDAGARRIVISLWPEQWRLRVADDGRGIAAADLPLAAAAHSTSKLRQEADLWRVSSLGFRGEALHSLAQLGQLRLRSRVDDAPGWQADYNNRGELTALTPTAIAPGTVVDLQDLFAAWPERQQALGHPAQQLRRMQLTLQELALAHPQVSWQVHRGDRPWLAYPACPHLGDRIAQLLRELRPGDWQERQFSLETSQGAGALILCLGLPDRCHRRRPDWVRVILNGRCIRQPELEQTLIGAFRRSLPRERFPLAIAHLTLPPAQVDWNRHPAKAEVYLQELPRLQEQLRQAVETLLGPEPLSGLNPRAEQLLRTAEAGARYGAEGGGSFTALAQLHRTYILAEHPGGLWLVEQHIADERVRFEQLQQAWALTELEQPLRLPPLGDRQRENLNRLGIPVEVFGPQGLAVRHLPTALLDGNHPVDALLELSQCDDPDAAQASVACRTALRNGQPLSRAEMQELLERWQRCRQPRTCPHGRPIALELQERDLARYFRRHWMIGRSHGL